MIFSGQLDPTLKEVTDMLYWYTFTSKDALSQYDAEKYRTAVRIAQTIKKACIREHRLHKRKSTLLRYYESELFLAYARAIEDIAKTAPLVLTKRNMLQFSMKTLETATFFHELIEDHFSENIHTG